MDSQDLPRTHSSGHDGHGFHVCNKCGWRFPNKHPSARHRRAHKRICGTIDGYKLPGSDVNTHLNDSDDEHSDEEHKTSSTTKVLARSNTGKGSGLIGEGSLKSEDGVFSDAVAEFSDCGSGAGAVEGFEDVREPETSLERDTKNGLNAIQSLNTKENTEITANQLDVAAELRGSFPTSSISSVTSPDSAVQDDRKGSEDDLQPIKYDILTDALPDSKKTPATDSVIESSLTSISHDGKMKGIEESNLARSIPYAVILPNKVADGTADGLSKLEGSVAMTSDSVRDVEVPSVKEHSHEFDMYNPQIDLHPEVESIEHVTDSVNAAENMVDTTDGIQHFNSGGLTESSNWKGEGDENVHVLSVPDDIEVVENPVMVLEGFKNHKVEKLNQPTFLDSLEQFNDQENDVKDPVSKENFEFCQSSHACGGTVASSDMHDLEASREMDGGSSKPMVNGAENKVDTTDRIHHFNSGGLTESSNWIGEGNENVHVLSVPDDIEVVKNPVVVLEGFKNHKVEKLNQPTFLDSSEQFNDQENDVKDPVSKENFEFFQSSHLSGGTVASSDMHDLEASHGMDGGSSKPMVIEVPTEEEVTVSQVEAKITQSQSPYEIVAPADAVVPRIATCSTVISPEGHESNDNYNESLRVSFSESDTNVLSDTNSSTVSSNLDIVQTTHLVGFDGNENDERCAIRGGQSSRKGPVEGNLVANPIATVQFNRSPTEFQISPGANLPENEDIGDYEKVISEKCNKVGDDSYHETCKLDEDDNRKVATGKFFGEGSLSNLEPVSCLFECEVGPASNSLEAIDASDFEKDKTNMHDIIVDDGGSQKAEKNALTEDNCSKVTIEKTVVENPIVTLDLHEGDVSGDHDEENLVENPLTSLDLHDGDDFGDHDEENLVAKPKLNLDSSSNSGRVDLDIVSGTPKSGIGSEIDCSNKVQLESVVSTAAGSDPDPDVKLPQKSLVDSGIKEQGLSSLDAESSVLSFTAAEDNCSREYHGASSELSSHYLQEESDKCIVRQQLSPSALDVVDSNSQADSLEGNWGSVSVVSIQSDAQAVVDAEAVPRTDSQASLEENKPKSASGRQYPDKSDMFEAPSFMTLVEPQGTDSQKATPAEIQTTQNPEQPKSASLQTVWFPSITQVVNESPGRKKNEEIIAKGTNWSTGKQPTPLKNLLGEAYLENKAKSPNPKESPLVQRDDKAVKAKDGGSAATTVNSILAPESPTSLAAKKENAKEGNSPARYPSDIRTEKRKAKGWTQFLCCSSVH